MFKSLCIILALASLTLAAPPATEPAPVPAGTAVYVGDEMLRNYHPRSNVVVPVHLIDKPKFPVVDIHCHWPLTADPKYMIKMMDTLGVHACVNLSGGYGGQFTQMIARFHTPYPDRLFIFCNLDFKQIDDPQFGQKMAAWLEQAHAQGAAGLKIFKDFGLTIKDHTGQVVPVDDPRLDPVWEKAGQLHMPVLIHSADPIAFFLPVDETNERWMQLKRHPDWSFYGPQFPKRDDILVQLMSVVGRHRGTTFIGAHMASESEDLAMLGHWLDDHPNLVVDLSGREAELGRQPYTARAFFMKYKDRVLYGTDRYPGRLDQPRYRIYYRLLETTDEYFQYHDNNFPPTGEWRIYGMGLPEDVLESVYHKNADRVLGLSK